MIAPRFKNNRRKINLYLRAKTSAGGIHLPPVLEEILEKGESKFLRLGFDWIVFEKDLTLHSIQLFAEVRTKSGIVVDYELDEEKPIGKGDNVWHMPARKGAHFTTVVPLKFVLTLDPSYTPARP